MGLSGWIEMEIYVVAHRDYTDENVFFTSRITAEEYLERRAADLECPKEEWRIEKLTEGAGFSAEFLETLNRPTVFKLDAYGDPMTELV